jgi:hypothetical protein
VTFWNVAGRAAVTAGVIESELGAKSLCDVERYYSAESAYHSVADAIRRRMEVPLQVLLLLLLVPLLMCRMPLSALHAAAGTGCMPHAWMRCPHGSLRMRLLWRCGGPAFFAAGNGGTEGLHDHASSNQPCFGSTAVTFTH